MSKNKKTSTYTKQELVDLIAGLQEVENLESKALAVISFQNVININALLKDLEDTQEAREMNLAMCGGDSELMPDDSNNEMIVIDKESGKIYTLQQIGSNDDYDLGMIEESRTLKEMYPEGWQM